MAESESRGPLVNAIAIAFAVISFITLCLRLFARVFISKSIGPDDCTLGLSPYWGHLNIDVLTAANCMIS